MPLQPKAQINTKITQKDLAPIKKWILSVANHDLKSKILIYNFTNKISPHNQFVKYKPDIIHNNQLISKQYEVHLKNQLSHDQKIKYQAIPLDILYKLLNVSYLNELQFINPTIDSFEWDMFFTIQESPKIHDLLYSSENEFLKDIDDYSESVIFYFLQDLIPNILDHKLIIQG